MGRVYAAAAARLAQGAGRRADTSGMGNHSPLRGAHRRSSPCDRDRDRHDPHRRHGAGRCGDLQRVVIAGVATCTHGGDEPAASTRGVGLAEPCVRSAYPAGALPGERATGAADPRLLGYPSDTTAPDAAAARPMIKQALALADQNLDAQSPAEARAALPFWCGTDRAVTITTVRLVGDRRRQHLHVRQRGQRPRREGVRRSGVRVRRLRREHRLLLPLRRARVARAGRSARSFVQREQRPRHAVLDDPLRSRLRHRQPGARLPARDRAQPGRGAELGAARERRLPLLRDLRHHVLQRRWVLLRPAGGRSPPRARTCHRPACTHSTATATTTTTSRRPRARTSQIIGTSPTARG